ncbi:hypothetical protein BDK51DRAFT_27874 [Blyttiomyces helicus]|uniref:Uncharacterized protein n=1 Tax=Blyttiomyces helicus TaxID=388810 RepID=A0A4P9W9U1_9FUNG|nr:hypothetical protein BDK51DRAFT_27874 [Blyttiomyces helicus]|eukprot:RKO89331.1 hypothetical protein BDK51DRAFT_27874 [Blyttiomyces helicus]
MVFKLVSWEERENYIQPKGKSDLPHQIVLTPQPLLKVNPGLILTIHKAYEASLTTDHNLRAPTTTSGPTFKRVPDPSTLEPGGTPTPGSNTNGLRQRKRVPGQRTPSPEDPRPPPDHRRHHPQHLPAHTLTNPNPSRHPPNPTHTPNSHTPSQNEFSHDHYLLSLEDLPRLELPQPPRTPDPPPPTAGDRADPPPGSPDQLPREVEECPFLLVYRQEFPPTPAKRRQKQPWRQRAAEMPPKRGQLDKNNDDHDVD